MPKLRAASRMHMLMIVVVLLNGVGALKLLSAEYERKVVEPGVGEKLDGYVIHLTFDEALYLNGRPFALKDRLQYRGHKAGSSVPSGEYLVCMGITGQRCHLIPSNLKQLMGHFELKCDDALVGGFPNTQSSLYNRWGTPGFGGAALDFLIPLAPTEDPMLALASDVGYLNISWTPSPAKLSFLVLNEFTRYGIQHQFGARPADIDRCFLDLTDELPLADAQGRHVSIAHRSLQELNLVCDPAPLNSLRDQFLQLVDVISDGGSWQDVLDRIWSASFMYSSDELSACLRLVDSFLNSKQDNRIVQSDACSWPSTSPEWKVDPCCNTTLAYKQCCVSRGVRSSRIIYQSPKATVDSQCSDSDRVRGALQELSGILNKVSDPVTGCLASLRTTASVELVTESLKFIQDCQSAIYAQPCSSDQDCLCGICNSINGICFPPQDVGTLERCLATCYADRVSTPVANALKNSWLLPLDSTEQQFAEELIRRNSKPQCIGQPGLTKDQCLAAGKCITDPSQQEEIRCPGAATGEKVCAVCSEQSGFECVPLATVDQCVIDVDNQLECQDAVNLYFQGDARLTPAWNDAFRTCAISGLPQILCLCGSFRPSDVCKRGFCEVPGVSRADCDASKYGGCYPDLTWHQALSVCEINVRPNKQACESAHGVWHVGRHISRAPNQHECAALSPCLVNGELRFGEECQVEGQCVGRTCGRCKNKSFRQGLCVSDQLQECECLAAGGEHVSSGTCVFPRLHGSACTSAGHQVLTCESITSERECGACAASSSPSSSSSSSSSSPSSGCTFDADLLLTCSWEAQAPCTREQCSQGGFCERNADFPACALPYSYVDGAACPRCVGVQNPQAPLEDQLPLQYSVFGCLNFTRDRLEHFYCTVTGGGRWIERATTEAECSALGTACDLPALRTQCRLEDPYTQGYLPTRDCSSCGGTPRNAFDWRVAVWKPLNQSSSSLGLGSSDEEESSGSGIKTSWSDTWIPSYSYGDGIDVEQLEQSVFRAAVVKPALALESAFKCRYLPQFAAFIPAACSCSEFESPVPCFDDSLGTIELGGNRFCSGDRNVGLQVGAAFLEFSQSSLLPQTFCVEVELQFISSLQFREESAPIIATDPFLQLLVQDSNPYAIIRNDDNDRVGQLTTDGVFVNMKQLKFESNSSSSSRRRSDHLVDVEPVAGGRIALCIEESDIPFVRSEYPVLDFAYVANLSAGFNPVPMGVSVLKDGSKYCATVDKSGSYFPIALRKNWDQPQGVFGPSLAYFQTMLFVLSGLYWGLFALALLALLNHYRSAGPTFGLQKAVHMLVALFGLIRAVYFLLFGTGVAIELLDGPARPVNLILAELPTYVFFSLYSVLILFWANIVTTTRAATNRFLGKMTGPFITVNVILYLLFIVVIILGATISVQEADIVNKVYKCIVAAICLGTASFFLVFGCGVIGKTRKGARLRAKRGGTSTGSATVKLGFIMVVGTVALLMQVTWLLYLTFTQVAIRDLIVPIFVLYILIEFVPAVTFLIVLFAPSESQRDTHASRRSTRSGTFGRSRGGTKSTASMSGLSGESREMSSARVTKQSAEVREGRSASSGVEMQSLGTTSGSEVDPF